MLISSLEILAQFHIIVAFPTGWTFQRCSAGGMTQGVGAFGTNTDDKSKAFQWQAPVLNPVARTPARSLRQNFIIFASTAPGENESNYFLLTLPAPRRYATTLRLRCCCSSRTRRMKRARQIDGGWGALSCRGVQRTG